MIRIGQREFEVPLWLWVAVPFAFAIYGACGATIYGAVGSDPDGYYLRIVRQGAAASLAGFLLVDLIRRSTTPWYGLPFLWLVSSVASSFAVGWLTSSLTETTRTVVGLAISAAGSRGGYGATGLMLGIAMVGVPLFSGLALALTFTFASRLIIGLPLWAKDTRREFWANFGGAFLWLGIALGGYIAIRSFYGLGLGHPASAVPGGLPLAAAGLGISIATVAHLWLAYRFRRRLPDSRHGLRVWLLAAVCMAALVYRPDVFGGRLGLGKIGYDYVRPMLRAMHLLPSPALSIAAYRVEVPFHDFRTRYGAPMPDGKPSYLSVPLPTDYGLTAPTSRPTVSIYRRDITLQQTSIYWTDRRKVLEDMKTAQPGADAIVRFPGLRGAIGLRSDQYPDVDIQLGDFDPAVSTETAEQALRRFLRERLRRVS